MPSMQGVSVYWRHSCRGSTLGDRCCCYSISFWLKKGTFEGFELGVWGFTDCHISAGRRSALVHLHLSLLLLLLPHGLLHQHSLPGTRPAFSTTCPAPPFSVSLPSLSIVSARMSIAEAVNTYHIHIQLDFIITTSKENQHRLLFMISEVCFILSTLLPCMCRRLCR